MTLNRRNFMRVAGGGAVLIGTAGVAPAAHAVPSLIPRGRPRLTHGVQSGDVRARSGILWTRADRPSRMIVEVSRRPDFKDPWTIKGPTLRPATDFTGKVRLRGLKPGSTVYYRIHARDHVPGEPLTGSFTTAPERPADIRFVWSADLAGQGWGINPDTGGYRIFDAMAALKPDFFLCSGDFYYGDNPLPETVELPDGRLWRNLIIEEKLKVAESLPEFRGQYKYNLLDKNLRAFLAAVPMVNQWDDHEVVNNWYPGEILDLPEYTEKRVDVLAARARRAFEEYTPSALRPGRDGRIYRRISYGPLLDVFVLDMRTYKDANGPNDSPTATEGLLGAAQTAWLKRELGRSRATWKVIANDLPLCLLVYDGTAWESVAQGDDGVPLGREREIADVLAFAKRQRVTGMVWLTADVHYTAAHYYDPNKAKFQDFDPFWEFVSGPLNAGGFGPGRRLDLTFGPERPFAQGPPRQGASPAEGAQFFGEVAIDGSTRALTVRLRDLDGAVLYTQELTPAH